MSDDFIHGTEHEESTDGVRPIASKRFSTAGFVGTAPDAFNQDFVPNTPYRIRTTADIKKLGANGTLPDALSGFIAAGGRDAIIVIADDHADPTDQFNAVIGDAGTKKGVYALLNAQSVLGVTPKLLAAPGFTSDGAEAQINGVVAALKAIAPKLRATAIVSGPNTDDADAIAAAALIGSDRIMMVDPFGLKSDPVLTSVAVDPAPYVIGGMAARPYWESPSNKPLLGLLGPARPIVHTPDDPDSQTNLLGEAYVTTIINRNGVRLWGNRGTGNDPQTSFINVRRIRDAVAEAIIEAHQWAIDRNISVTLGQDIVEGVNNFLRKLQAQGAIINGRAWLNTELNTPESLANGQVYVDYDIAPSTPLERLTFTAYINNDYFEELAGDILSAA